MCIELRDYSKDLGPRLLSKEQIKQVIQSFQTSYTYEVPSKITSVALESVIVSWQATNAVAVYTKALTCDV